MQSVEFKEGESDVFIFEVQSEDDDSTSVDKLKATITDLEKQIADFSEKRIASRERNGQGDEPCREDSFNASNQAAKKNETIKSLNDKIKDLTIQVAKFKDEASNKDEILSEFNKLKDSIRERDFNEFIDKQIDGGILTPANKDAVFSILCDLDNVKKFDESSNSIDKFKEFIQALPKQVEFDEVAKKDKSCKPPKVDEFEDASEESLEIYKEAKNIAETEKIDFKEALLKVQQG